MPGSKVFRIGIPRLRAVDGLALAALGLLAWVSRGVLLWEPSSMGTGYQDPVEGFLYDAGGGGTPLISLAIMAWMVWRRRDDLAADSMHAGMHPSGRWLAVIPLCLAIVVRAWAGYVDALDLQLPALALLLLAGAGILAGRRGMVRMWLPCLVLVTAMPVPVALLNWIIHPMQLMTARGASAILELFGVSHLLMGEQIHTPGHAFYVIEGCAGLRSLQTLLLATIVYCDVLFRSRGQVVLLVLSVVPVGLITNQLRVLSIILDPSSDLSGDHTAQGLVMTSVGVIAIAIIDSAAQRLASHSSQAVAEAEPERSGVSVEPSGKGGAFRPRAWILLVLLASLLAIGPSWMPIWTPPERAGPRLAVAIPTRIDDWRAARTLEIDREFLGSVRYSDWLDRLYRSDAGEFELMIVADHHESRHHGVISTKTALAHPGQIVESREAITIGEMGRPGTRLVLRGLEGATVVLHWRLNVRSRLEELVRSALALDRSSLHRRLPTLALRLSTELSPDPHEARRQEALITEVAGWVDQQLVDTGLALEP